MSAIVPQITSMVPFDDVIMSKDHPIAGPYGRDMDVPRELKVGFDVFFFYSISCYIRPRYIDNL